MDSLNFMSIGSNCACIHFLGPDRIKGPVDNMAITDAYILKYLIDNTLFEYISNNKNFKISKPRWGKGRQSDPDVWFVYKYLYIIHNDPRTKNFKEELKSRILRFNDFINKVKTQDNYYFTFCLNEWMVDTSNHKLKNKTFYYVCEYLKSINLLDKIIFVELHADNIPHGGYCNCYIQDMDEWKKKYNLKTIELFCEDKIDTLTLYNQFINKVKELIK